MITLYDCEDNILKEKESIEYEYDLKKVCEEYTEDNLLFYQSGNRMGGLGGIIILYKDNKYRILYIDEENELLFKEFPIAMNMEMELFDRHYDLNYKNEKYEWYDTGFGGKLYVDRKIFDDFKNALYSFFEKAGEPIENNYPTEYIMYGYWLTIAKSVLNKKSKN